jgi:hypothetical protein
MKFDQFTPGEQSQKWHDYNRQKDNSIMTDLFEG